MGTVAGDVPSNHQTHYFIRNDDVGDLTDGLKNFAETFALRRMPVSYQIIPSKFTARCADFLLSVDHDYPGLVEFGQHGLNHEMILKGRHLKREFGPERSFIEQGEDIRSGLEILRGYLGSQSDINVFTPPQHKYDSNTVRAAVGSGHKIFSAACYASFFHQAAYALGRRLRMSSFGHYGISYHNARRPEADIFEVSVSVTMDDGQVIRTESHRVFQRIAAASVYSNVVGLMFHHKMYESLSDRDELNKTANLLEKLGPKNFCRLANLTGPENLTTPRWAIGGLSIRKEEPSNN
jgi:hypothetical protein